MNRLRAIEQRLERARQHPVSDMEYTEALWPLDDIAYLLSLVERLERVAERARVWENLADRVSDGEDIAEQDCLLAWQRVREALKELEGLE